jgi:hypothetical protein
MESFIIQFKKLARRIDVTRIKIVINKFNKINFKSNKSNVLTFTIFFVNKLFDCFAMKIIIPAKIFSNFLNSILIGALLHESNTIKYFDFFLHITK